MGCFRKLLKYGLLCTIFGMMGSSVVSPSDAQELKTINFMGTNEKSCGNYPQFILQEFGFLEKEGYQVNLLATDTTVPYVAFLANGDADLAMLDSGQVLQAVSTGQAIKVVYEAQQFGPEGVYAPADGPVQSLADLRGKIVGLPSDRDLIIATIALESAGVGIDEVETVVVGDSGPVLVKSLQDGTVHAVIAAPVDRAIIETSGVALRDLTPPEVSYVPGNSLAVWEPTLEEKRPLILAFLRSWAKGQRAGVLDSKAVMSACKKRAPEQWERPGNGERVLNNSIYTTSLSRTMKMGEPQPDVWARIQAPYVRLKEIDKEIDTATFLEPSFIAEVNDFTTDDVKAGINKFREANADILIP